MTLPQQNENQRRGMQASDTVAIALSKVAFVNRVAAEVDIGVDFICEWRNDDQPTGKLFNVQCKVLPLKDQDDPVRATVPVKTRSARYWLQLPSPTVLLVADVRSGKIYWSAPVEQLVLRKDAWRQQDTVMLDVLKSTEFSCFDALPPVLCAYMQNGAAHVGVALRERLHDIETCMIEEQQCGPRPIDVAVASQLMSPQGALQDAFAMSAEIGTFQNSMAKLIAARTRKYVNDLWVFSQKWYGKQLRLEGRVGTGLDDDFGAGVPRVVIDHAREVLETLDDPPTVAQIQALIVALDRLESLQRNLFSYEEVLRMQELPLALAILSSIGKSR